MNNTLTAKEWLDKENYYDDIFQETISSNVMERYANYKTQMLQGLILTYSQRLKKLSEVEEILRMTGEKGNFLMYEILQDYNKYFNIISVTEGKINQNDI